MELLRRQKAERTARFASILCGTAGVLLLAAASSQAHSQNPEARPVPPEPGQVQTFFLKNVTTMNELNDIQTDLRNVLNRARIYAIASENAITLRGSSDDLATAQKLISELDQPKKIYRLTYTITELDGGKRAGSRSVSMLVSANGKATLKQGTKVPVLTGTSGSSSDANTQIQYIDLGLNVEANAFGSVLRTKIEQSSVADEKSTAGLQDPVIRQTVLEGVSPLTSGKSVVLGTMELPGSTHQQQISVSAETLTPQD